MTTWESICDPPATDEAWELFHENSKTGRFSDVRPTELVLARMAELAESLPYTHYPTIPLPDEHLPLERPLGDTLADRVSARSLRACPLTLPAVATLLHHAYGVTRTNVGTGYPRPFRSVPSGGALYPLEIYFHSTRVEGIEPGLYHYNPAENLLHLIRYGDRSRQICEGVLQGELLANAAMVVFVTALFERSVFKYGDRGYRFVLLEAGHVAQNLALVANALGLASVGIGGYFDREVDELIGIDGLAHSTIYLTALGRDAGAAPGPGGPV
ncbi:SagB/ThcOx family dehydrogenase [Pseudonocardia tropica]|uniref:SagB/ThcOx family dehydrogenase n=1 Tax=Pseudonocardia tropica TaxID=681289 RepID=A0ABV1K434_9PSEU